MDRQVYYRAKSSMLAKQDIAKEMISMVRAIRMRLARIGTHKLYHLLETELKDKK